MKQITNLQILQSIRKPMPPAKRVELDKRTKLKSDRVGRKAKHKKG